LRRAGAAGAVVAALIMGAAMTPAPAGANTPLLTSNNTPFPRSTVISGATWTSPRHGPPGNQWGDILPTPWADDNNLYVLMDDGGTGAPEGHLWRNSFARITGTPGKLKFQRVGASAPSATWSQIAHNRALWTGPLGSFYSTGFAIVDHVFYATQDNDWNWNANGPFQGLAGIAYSTNHGQTWNFPRIPFTGTIGNLNWVQWGPDESAPDGYVYAIATEREFNASTLILGRSLPNIADMTNPADWQWAAGWVPGPTGGQSWPVWTSSIAQAQPILTWQNHITYPRMTYDAGIHRYLLTFTFSYGSTPPGIWQYGSELEILEAPHPWGPFSFVARNPYFGPANAYDPAFPVKWISRNGQDLWIIYAANFDGCGPHLDCAAAYGFNYQRLHLTLAPASARDARAARAAPHVSAKPPPPPPQWRNLPATPPKHIVPRLFLKPELRHVTTGSPG
jgi:hypothetical protein